MSAFIPNHPNAVALVIFGIFFLVLSGYIICLLKNQFLSRLLGWSIVIIMTAAIHFALPDQPEGYRMLAIIIILFVSMKIVVANEYRIASLQPLTGKEWFLFAIGWFGMNPRVFARRDYQKKNQGLQLISVGVSRMILGIGLCILAFLIAHHMQVILWLQMIIVTTLLLIGLSLLLHFGVLNINSGLLNLLGFGAYSLFKDPLRSESLKEFWGKRWNVAFSEMSAIAVYRPLKKTISNESAQMTAFAFSGILHELAISLPVNRGFGLPSLYFVLQFIAILIEKRIKFENTKLRLIWILAWLILPMPILFHTYFLEGIIWPIINYNPGFILK